MRERESLKSERERNRERWEVVFVAFVFLINAYKTPCFSVPQLKWLCTGTRPSQHKQHKITQIHSQREPLTLSESG